VCLLACNAHPTKVGGGVTRGRLRAINMSSNRHAPGPSGGKHPGFRKRTALRGAEREQEPRPAQWERRESPALRTTPGPATMGCSSSFGGGEPLSTSSCGVACEARGGPSLQAARPAQIFVTVSTHRRRNRRRGRGGARKRHHEGRWPSAFHFSASLQRREASVDGSDAARCPLILKGVGYRTPSSTERGRAGSEGKRGGRAASKRPSVQGGRESDARGACPCVVVVKLQKSLGGVGPREACALPFHQTWGACGDGGLDRSQPAGAKSAAQRLRPKGRRGPYRSGNPSRDRYSRTVSARAGARVSPNGGRHLRSKWLVLPSRGDLLRGLGGPKYLGSCESAVGRMGRRQGCQRYGSSGIARKKTPRTNPGGPPKRIGRRETPGPPVSWVCVRAHGSRAKRKLRRDAGNR
jgi:hypothetical protein